MKIVYGRDQKIKGSLTGDFDKDYAFLEAVFERSGDIVKNPFCIADFCRAAAIYVDGMTDADMVEDFVIRPLLFVRERQIIDFIAKNNIYIAPDCNCPVLWRTDDKRPFAREKTKQMLKEMEEANPNFFTSLKVALGNVHLNSLFDAHYLDKQE